MWQGTSPLNQKITFLFAVMRNGFALILLRVAAMVARTGKVKVGQASELEGASLPTLL